MGQESSKAHQRRQHEGYFERFLKGHGIDIGCGDDPVTPECVRWDLPQGDAQTLSGVAAESFDWVYSSHCLEHLPDPFEAVKRWWEVLRPSGYLLLAVPDEDLYEQGVWPSRFNPDHRWTFTVQKSQSWSPVSINLTDLIAPLPGHQVEWLRRCDQGYDYSGGVWDRTHTKAEAHVEALVRKLPSPTASPIARASLAQTLWEWWGSPEHPAEWDGVHNGGGKGSQRFWEYLWTLQQIPRCRCVLDGGGGVHPFLADLLSTQIPQVWCVDPQIPVSRQRPGYVAQTLRQFLVADPACRTRFECVTCVSVLEHVEDKVGFCRDLDEIQAPIVMTFELAFEADLVTMAQVYRCFAAMPNHYLARMEVCPVWADNSRFGQWRPLGVVLEVRQPS